jgi:BarA-like signal transduction histidine kinase
MEFYLVPLSNGDSLAIAFRWNLSIQREEVEKIISMVSSTLKEIPKE